MEHDPKFISTGITIAYIFDQIATFKFLCIHLDTFQVLLFFRHQRGPRKNVGNLIPPLYHNRLQLRLYLLLYVGVDISDCSES